MELFLSFIVSNFVLFCISIVVLTNAIQNRKTHRKTSIYFILIIALALSLAVQNTLELHARNVLSIPYATIVAAFGYICRPVVVYLFILMSIDKKSWKWILIRAIPLMINAIIICLAFIPTAKELVYWYVVEDGSMHWMGGYLRYSSHIISLLYLIWLVYASIAKLKSKHLNHAIAIITCASFVVLAVVIESFFNNGGDIYLLNATIGVSAMTYYLFLYKENTQLDPLTGLFNRDTYYRDLPRMDKTITGVIQFDLNGLKYLNDTYGHLEGDNALSTVATIILKCSNRSMYVYRLGGDEFIVIVINSSKETILKVVEDIKQKLDETTYHCSIGYAFREKKSDGLEEVIKQAEKEMYIDKDNFYRDTKLERRKSHRIEE